YLSYYFHYVSFFFSSRRRHTRSKRDWSSDVCSSDLTLVQPVTANLSEVIFFITEEQSLKHLAGCFRIRHFTGSYLPINLAQCRRSEERRVGKERMERRALSKRRQKVIRVRRV